MRVRVGGQKACHGSDVHHDEEASEAHQRQAKHLAIELGFIVIGITEEAGACCILESEQTPHYHHNNREKGTYVYCHLHPWKYCQHES